MFYYVCNARLAVLVWGDLNIFDFRQHIDDDVDDVDHDFND